MPADAPNPAARSGPPLAPIPQMLHALQTRRSSKLATLGPPGPAPEQLRTMLTIAARTPDHAKLVPWRFIVIEGDRRHDLGRVIGEAFDADHPGATEAERADARARVCRAPTVIAVVFCLRGDPANPGRPHPHVTEWEQVLSCGAACMNLLHAAHALGLGAVWLTEWYAYHPRVSAALGLTGHERLAGFVHIGTAPCAREDRPRPDMGRIVTRW